MIGMNLKYLRKSTDIHRRIAERLEVSDSLLQSGKTRNLFPCRKCVSDGADFETTVEMLLVSFFTRKNLTHSDGDEYIFGIVKVSERGQITLPKHTPERCSELGAN